MNPENLPEDTLSSEPTSELRNGEVLIENVPYFSQRLDEGNYRQEGFTSLDDAKYWSDRVCGLACVKMAIGTFAPDKSVGLKELLDRGLEIGAYREDAGWIHQGLVNLAAEYGIGGGRESIGQDIEKIAKHLQEGRIVVPSVTVGFEAGKEYQRDDGSSYVMQRGGHLVVVFGTDVENHRVEDFQLHHPSSWPSYEWPNYHVKREDFAKSFSERGNIIYFENSPEQE